MNLLEIKFSVKNAKRIGKKIGVRWKGRKKAKFTPKEFSAGMDDEQEHGDHDPETDVIRNVNGHDDPKAFGKVAWAHLKKDPKYYTHAKQRGMV